MYINRVHPSAFVLLYGILISISHSTSYDFALKADIKVVSDLTQISDLNNLIFVEKVTMDPDNAYSSTSTLFVRKPLFSMSFNFLTFPVIEPEIFLAFAEINWLKWVTLWCLIEVGV